ncbi:protein phosphatase PP2A regulatory subunit B [Histomonas meleagridis]|uniref:protein phosphatase PP2A regulatory subunit B n=1 Tax=Histomonas meleagridis TaxID=135588 RepID=UPI00355ABA3B|nr:protein phosphatase PP2A regulatory subunit B [Histomonas meleagridis]KAH0799924.1 protein phosphatase PP2A regulatory subunit B [Histomonas meleagridis]
MNLKFLAAFGDHVPLSQFKPDDTISTLAFSHDGQFLASGDQAGRVVVFKLTYSSSGRPTISFSNQIHAHKSQFDYFRSEISEMRVNSLKWIPRQTINPLLISCNSHDAKLWHFNSTPRIAWNTKLKDTYIFPMPQRSDTKYAPECIRTFNDIQTEYIVDLQTLSDQRSFLMVDVTCVKLWDIERDIKSVCLCKISQQDSEITASGIQPNQSSTFMVGNDGGFCKMYDLRQEAENLMPLFDINTSKFSIRQQFSDECSMIGSISFSRDGNNFVVRRFNDLQVWDIRNLNSPCAKLEVQWFPNQMEYLLSEDYVKDQFRTAFTAKDKIVTGCYSADYIAWDWKRQKATKHKAVSARNQRLPPEPGKDFNKRVTVCEAHPRSEIVAVVSTAALFFYYGTDE